MPTSPACDSKPDHGFSKLSRAMSKLSIRTEERKAPKAFTLDAHDGPWSIPIPPGISRTRAREYMHSTFIAPNGRPFLPQHSEILPNRLFVSDRYTGTEPAVLAKLGVTHVVCIGDSAAAQIRRPRAGIRCHDMVVPTDADRACCILAQIDDTVDFIDSALRKDGARVLVHCSTGVAWSPGVAIAWLMRNEHCTYEAGRRVVKRKREVVSLSLEIEKGVREWWALEVARPLFPPGRGGRDIRHEASAPRYTIKLDVLDDDSLGEVIDIK